MSIWVFLLPLLAFAAPPTASDRLVLKDTFGSPELKVLRQGSEKKAETVTKGAELFVGDIVETVARQVVSLESFDGSVWKLAPNTKLKLEARVPQKKDFFHWTFAMQQGAMWGKVLPRKDAEGFRLKVKTRNAAMGIRGTEYRLETKEDFTGLDVLEGVVWFGNASGFEPGTYVEVKAGEHAEIGGDGKPKASAMSTAKGATLTEKYGLSEKLPSMLSETVENAPNSPEDCRVRGEGWASKTGATNRGECKK
jgi:hypothetical protein